MIYSSANELIDCEYVRKKDLVNDFLRKFFYEIDIARSRNFTTPASMQQQHEQQQRWMDKELYDAAPPAYEFNSFGEIVQSENIDDAFGMRNLTYKLLRDESDIPDDIRQIMNYDQLKEQCHTKHREMQKIVHDINSEDEESRITATEHLER